MIAKINKDGELSIDLLDIFNSLRYGESYEIFLDSFSCEDAVIKNVMDQVLDGFTGMFSSGCDYDNGPNLKIAIGKQRQRIMEMSINKLKDDEIERLKRCLIFETKRADELEEELYKFLNENPH
jgi:hypothetical protein